MKDVIVMLSGGFDSMYLAYMAHEAGRLAAGMFVDYGQAALKQERIAARRWCAAHSVPLIEKTIPLAGLEVMNGTPTGASGARLVPGRNLVLIALATNEAEAMRIRSGKRYAEVWIGCTATDNAGYPDCRQAFINPLKPIIHKAYGVDLRAPCLHTPRAEMVKTAKEKGWDLTVSWSCYRPTEDGQGCGTCDSCKQDRP